MELEALQDIFDKFVEADAAIIVLCPQRQVFNQEITEELGLSFPVVQDTNNLVASGFGLTLETPPDVIEAERFLGIDLPEHNGTDHWDLPMPARYVIDQSGIVRYASVHADHRMRSEPQECLTVMD